MTASANPEEGLAVVRLLGEADAYSAPRVRDDLAAALGGEAPLVIDLTRATFVDSTIMGVMLESLKRCEQLDRKFLLLLPEDGAPEIHRLFKLTGLEKLLPVVRSWEEAAERLVAQ
jgi:anti-sigma B factor antagonist